MLDSEGMKTNRIWQPNSNRQGGVKNRFRILPFENSRTSSQSWRVTGSKRDGIRVRENFSDQAAAQARRVELETEWLGQQTDTALRATKLTEAQSGVSESVLLRAFLCLWKSVSRSRLFSLATARATREKL